MKTQYSILELAMVGSEISIEDTLKNALDLARRAEKLGYKRFWLAEHHNMISIASSATSVLIAHIAAGTQSIRVGSGGIMLPNHSPLIVAEQFGTLARLHPGRIDLGLGRAPGTDQVTAHAIRSDRTQSVYAFPEEVEMIQRYFSKENRDSKVRATVAEGVEVPIYILGSSTDSAHLAAHKGLPYAFASHFAPAQMQAALGIYHNQFRPSKYLDQPNTLAGLNVILAETDEAAERLSTSMIRMMLGVLTGNIDYMQEPVEMSAELREIARHPALQQMLKYTFVGSPETVREQVRAFRDQTRVDEIIAVSHIYHHEDRVKSFELFAEVMRSL